MKYEYGNFGILACIALEPGRRISDHPGSFELFEFAGNAIDALGGVDDLEGARR